MFDEDCEEIPQRVTMYSVYMYSVFFKGKDFKYVPCMTCNNNDDEPKAHLAWFDTEAEAIEYVKNKGLRSKIHRFANGTEVKEYVVEKVEREKYSDGFGDTWHIEVIYAAPLEG